MRHDEAITGRSHYATQYGMINVYTLCSIILNNLYKITIGEYRAACNNYWAMANIVLSSLLCNTRCDASFAYIKLFFPFIMAVQRKSVLRLVLSLWYRYLPVTPLCPSVESKNRDKILSPNF